MPFGPETVALSGSGLVFNNSYSTNVSAAYRSAIIAAENFFQTHFTNSVALNMSFDLQPISGLAANSFSTTIVSYGTLTSALRTHAVTSDDLASVASLPTGDPSGGLGFALPFGMARALGLAGAPSSGRIDDTVILNSSLPLTFGQDAIGDIEHEISEGALGRIGSLGISLNSGAWAPMDLFRYTASGQHDYTGGRDGLATYFSVDGRTILTQFQYHNSVNRFGQFDGSDFADWDNTVGDAFGPGTATSPDVVSATDLRVMDILGWTPTGAQPTAPTDDFASSFTDTSHSFGLINVNGSATGTLESIGDRDWFRIQLTAGSTYVISLLGQHAGAGTLEDPYLRLHDGNGLLLAQNDDIVDTVNRDSQLTFTATANGNYYLEAGSFEDRFVGTYKLSVTSTAPRDDFANSLTDFDHPIGTVVLHSLTNGTIETPGDRDWFAVSLTAGRTYTISLQGQHAGSGTLEDPYLRLHNGGGAVIAENDDIVDGVNRDSQITITPTTSGFYWVEAGAFNDQYTGTYRLILADGPAPSRIATPGRTPEPLFDAAFYRAQNADVVAAGIDPQLHYDQFGWRENRNPDALFDTAYYLQQNQDVARAGIDPLLHFETSGWREGRNPGPAFNLASYLQHNPDVASAGINPLDHYLLYGIAEGRPL